MDFIPEESVFEVLNDNHDYFLDTFDVSILNLGVSPRLSSKSISDEKFDFSDILDDNHDLYLDTSDLIPKISYKSLSKTSINITQKSTALNFDDHLEYLSFIQKEYETQNNAVKKIQNYWRSYYHKKLFFKIKKLVLKYSNSNPAVTLRIVNPREAALLDKASGTFIKFKLAGTKFPPKIVYKIVSRTPIIKVDMLCQPRDEKSTMTDFHREPVRMPERNTEMSGRVTSRPRKSQEEEKNDWRPYIGDAYCTRRRKSRVQTGRSKSCARPHPLKTLEKKLNELSWIKSHYGF